MNKDNDGLIVLNGDAAHLPAKTVIVLGVPRGGTSMVAGSLSKLGVFMGASERTAPFYESEELGARAKARDKAGARSLIARYDSSHAVWGIKVLPKSWRFWLGQRLFREPVYVVVLRDVLAIAKRRVTSMDKDLLASAIKSGGAYPKHELAQSRAVVKEMMRALWLNFCLLAFMYFSRRPTLVVSYEKALLRPEDYVRGVAAFLGLAADEQACQRAVAFVTPSPREYVLRSTTHCQLDAQARLFGYLDAIEARAVSGWALSATEDSPLELELYVNGMLRRSARAELPRADVHQSDARFREHCGFVMELGEGELLAAGDRVEVKIAGSEVHLINSPHTVTR